LATAPPFHKNFYFLSGFPWPTPVNGDDVLGRLRKIPVSTWDYISEGSETGHMGPMVEDF
jgi:hypothetical protein